MRSAAAAREAPLSASPGYGQATELAKLIHYGCDFQLLRVMQELDALREENKKLRRKIGRRSPSR